MSRNSKIDYTQYVHEFTNQAGEARYAVAFWDEDTPNTPAHSTNVLPN